MSILQHGNEVFDIDPNFYKRDRHPASIVISPSGEIGVLLPDGSILSNVTAYHLSIDVNALMTAQVTFHPLKQCDELLASES